MYVCLCKNVTDHRIRGAVEEGARSWRAVQEATGCGTQCGKCACEARRIVRELNDNQGVFARFANLAYELT